MSNFHENLVVELILCCPIFSMKVLTMILLTSVVMLTNTLAPTVSASISNDYCFDQDSEDSFCYETQKACEIERKNDLMAESKCYKALE